jgi:hypothetical protein
MVSNCSFSRLIRPYKNLFYRSKEDLDLTVPKKDQKALKEKALMKLQTQREKGYFAPKIWNTSQTKPKEKRSNSPFLASIKGTMVDEGTPKNLRLRIPVTVRR